MVSKLFDLILLGFFLDILELIEGFSWISVSISSNLFSVSVSKILYLCLLDSLFQGNLSFGVSYGFHCYLIFFPGFFRFSSDSMDA